MGSPSVPDEEAILVAIENSCSNWVIHPFINSLSSTSRFDATMRAEAVLPNCPSIEHTRWMSLLE